MSLHELSHLLLPIWWGKVRQCSLFTCYTLFCVSCSKEKQRYYVLPLIMNLIKLLILGSHHNPIESESLELELEICILQVLLVICKHSRVLKLLVLGELRGSVVSFLSRSFNFLPLSAQVLIALCWIVLVTCWFEKRFKCVPGIWSWS